MAAEQGLTGAEAKNVATQIRRLATRVENELNAQLGRSADRGAVDAMRALADRVHAQLDDGDCGDDEASEPGVTHTREIVDTVAGSDAVG